MNLETQNFWIRVNSLIKENHITQETLCNECGIVLSTYKGWNLRGIYPNAKQLLDICKVLNTTPEYLIYNKKSDIPADIQNVIMQMSLFTEEERQPIIFMIKGQLEYWKKILKK